MGKEKGPWISFAAIENHTSKETPTSEERTIIYLYFVGNYVLVFVCSSCVCGFSHYRYNYYEVTNLCVMTVIVIVNSTTRTYCQPLNEYFNATVIVGF